MNYFFKWYTIWYVFRTLAKYRLGRQFRANSVVVK